MSNIFPKTTTFPHIVSEVDSPRIVLSARAVDKSNMQASDSIGASLSKMILRFRKGEIATHWSIAIPFVMCFVTGFVLKLFFDLHSIMPYRNVISWLHRIGGAGLLFFPLINALRHRRDMKVHLYNIKKAWLWTFDDIKWLFLFGAAAVSKKIHLPEQHKFNAAEKINFMMVMVTYPFFIITGVILSLPGLHFATWLVHLGLAVMMAPLMLGHIYMALVNPSTRVGLTGMLNGHVDRDWAKHHYTHWYREHYGEEEKAFVERQNARRALQIPVDIRCNACNAHYQEGNLLKLLEAAPGTDSLTCPHCGTMASRLSMSIETDGLGTFMDQLAKAGIHGLSFATPSEPGPEPALSPESQKPLRIPKLQRSA